MSAKGRSVQRDGFAGPFEALEPDEMAALVPRLDALFAAHRRPTKIRYAVEPDPVEERAGDMEEVWNAHLRNRLVFDLATHPAVLAEVERAAGPELLLWRTTFWIKEPGARRLEWHQDTYGRAHLGYQRIVTAWIAIDEVGPENAVRLVPGTHHTFLPSEVYEEETHAAALRASRDLPPPPIEGPTVTMSMRPGQFFVFDQHVLHGSPPNGAPVRRAGLAARFIPTDADQWEMPEPCIRVAGRARPPRNLRLVSPPPRSEWAASSRVLNHLRLSRRPWQRAG
jgi:ectoine hydroxylase-related dioxygenase (phytanoyl-CoA dioxygenase family)